MIGTRFAHYEITAHLGSGGMGDVYQATDSKLGRTVAIKLLPEAFTHDADRAARFEREARMLASLNHPNIAAIYGVEESGGRKFLVMELVAGETLAQKISRGPIPQDESLSIALQITEALEAAHEKGVIHRDLKPANVKITPEGKVKVLDFGLAKAFEADPAQTNLSQSPTMSMAATMQGIILGTAAYMSPEQAVGKAVDKRSDIWAFGVVLFEMLTGEQLFPGGETVSHVLADVLRAPIDLSRLPATTLPGVRDLLERCLERDVKNRLRDIGEARVAIDRARKAPTAAASPPIPRVSTKAWIAAAVVAVLVASIAGVGWWRALKPLEHPFFRFTDDEGDAIDVNIANGPSIAISRDGLRMVMVTKSADGRSRLSQRLLSSAKSTIISGTEGASPVSPFFSPDGKWIGFFSDSKLKTISVEGGAAVTLCDVGGSGQSRGGYWGEDENILFSTQRAPVMRVSASGGTPVPATELAKDEVTNRFAQLLPGNEAFLFTASRDNNSWEEAKIDVQTIKTGKRKTLLTGGYHGRYLPGRDGNGYLLYIHEGIVFAAPMDLKRLVLTSPGVPVLEDVAGLSQNGFSQLDVAPSGTVVYVPGSGKGGQRLLALMDTSGKIQTLPASQAMYQTPARSSPDGTRLVVRITDNSGTNLSVYELAANRMTRLTFIKGSVASSGVWAPDGKHIVFPISSMDLAGPGIYWIRADGAGEPQRLTETFSIPNSFSPDGKRLAYFANPGTGSNDFGIWTLPLDLKDPEHPKAGPPELFLKGKGLLQNPAFSPDGRWIAYASFETQPPQVFVRPFVPGSTSKAGQWQISTDGATTPFWTHAGRELLFMLQATGVRGVSYTTSGDSFVASSSRPILEKSLSSLAGALDLMPDGKQFIVVTSGSELAARETHVAFLLNFSDELQRRAAASR
jgi:serine/threonine-protein kinase